MDTIEFAAYREDLRCHGRQGCRMVGQAIATGGVPKHYFQGRELVSFRRHSLSLKRYGLKLLDRSWHRVQKALDVIIHVNAPR
jgi:hypothetical protein